MGQAMAPVGNERGKMPPPESKFQRAACLLAFGNR